MHIHILAQQQAGGERRYARTRQAVAQLKYVLQHTGSMTSNGFLSVTTCTTICVVRASHTADLFGADAAPDFLPPADFLATPTASRPQPSAY